MRYKSDILVPITLAYNVVGIEFKRKVLASLDCLVCKRSRRTVVLYEQQEKSFCTPSNHGFPGYITQIQMSGRERIDSLPEKFIVTATYHIEHEFKAFTDEKYPHRVVSPAITWSRAAFTLTCSCGRETEQETQNNIARPRTAVCECGQALYYEIDKIPLFRATA